MTPDQERLSQHLRRLKLHRMEQVLTTVAEDATKGQLSSTAFLTQLLEAEVDARYERTTLSRIRLAHFPFAKRLADFDFSFQPSIDQRNRCYATLLKRSSAGSTIARPWKLRRRLSL